MNAVNKLYAIVWKGIIVSHPITKSIAIYTTRKRAREELGAIYKAMKTMYDGKYALKNSELVIREYTARE